MLKCIELNHEEVTLLCDEILDLHSRIISVMTFHSGINDEPVEARGLIESAIYASMCSHFGSISFIDFIEQIATLSARIAQNHAFLDGNKRVAVLIPQTLIDYWYPQYYINVNNITLYHTILDVVTGEIGVEQYANLIRNDIKMR